MVQRMVDAEERRETASERVARHRDKVLREGGKRATVTIEADAARASDELIKLGYASNLKDAINRSLIDARKRIK